MRVIEVLGFTVAAALVAVGALGVATAAAADPVPENGQPGLLSLNADPYPMQDPNMAPGDRIRWPITADMSAPDAAELTLAIQTSGLLASDPGGLRMSLQSCAVAWIVPADPSVDASCAAGEQTVLAMTPTASLDPSTVWHLGTIADNGARYFLVTLWLSPSADGALLSASGRVALGFTAAGETQSVSTDGPGLATTGADAVGLILLAGGLLLGGIVLASVRLRRRES